MTVALALLLAIPVLSSGPIQGQEADPLAALWVVGEYDEARDPADDLKMAAVRAQAEGKRILLEVGGEWCGWCHRLDAYIREHPSISGKLGRDFLIMKVNWSRDNHNEAFLSQFPAIRGYPHIFVMESDGTFLHSQGTAELEEGSSYNEQAILDFLEAWAPERGRR